jgi:preprotein translocase SecE subunit
VGIVVTLIPLVGLLYLGVRTFLRPGFDDWLGRLEDQGWFHATLFKGNQGVRVRRGTIIALLTLGGCGIYTLISHGTLKGAGDWQIVIPFTTDEATHTYLYIPLLPDLRYTLPLLLIAAMIWVSWRIVNWPVFADFLIATEAEMNKVSWTTRKRLFQDTIVVLVAVFLMTLFLFVTDIVWIKVLNNRFVNVLQIDPTVEKQKQQEQSQW